MSVQVISTYEVPLTPQPQLFNISLGEKEYNVKLAYVDEDEGGWVLDFADALTNTPILNGVPLVTGANLLGQYGYLGFGGGLFVQTDHSPDDPPTYTNLGTDSHLYFLVVTEI